jgi:hypothetical protein
MCLLVFTHILTKCTVQEAKKYDQRYLSDIRSNYVHEYQRNALCSDGISAIEAPNRSGGYINYSSRSGGGNENILFMISSVRSTVASLKHYCP